MASATRFFQKGILICVLMAFMVLICSSAGAEINPAQKQKLDKINELMTRLGAEGLTEQQKLEIMSEILQLTAQLADEAKAAGNPELAGEVLSMVIRVADLLPGMVQAASADVSALKAVADLSKTAAQIAQTVADTAKDANSRDLAQQTVTVAGKVKTVTEQVALAAQDILATSADEKEVGAATALIEEIRTIDAIVQSAVNTAKETGFSDTSPQFGTADHSRFGDAPQDEPIADSKPASPN